MTLVWSIVSSILIISFMEGIKHLCRSYSKR